ncbi:MAG: YifB family Mg chelatase-like AAA ATPase [Candidatus Kapaibacterium sp.]
MYSQLFSASVLGINAFLVEIECHLDSQLPKITIVGLPSSSVKESSERVSAAIKNSDYLFPLKKITINLAPADVRKDGSAFDLPIALGILASTKVIDQENLKDKMILGELALEGTLRAVHGTLSIAIKAKESGFKQILLPEENADEAAMVEGIEVIPIKDLREAVQYLQGKLVIEPRKVDLKKIFEFDQSISMLDINDVKGQENVKRAMEVAAAGGHNLLMIGPPGSGKTMIAKRLPSIMPPLTLDEALETTKIHSVSGMLSKDRALITTRPFRSPHHTISNAALVGGGVSNIRPGEISLAHHGVLFLDELPEFKRDVLEVMRQPLEDKQVTISRTKMTIDYPANFMLVCSMNPTPDGESIDKSSSTSQQIKRYLSKISGPLLDRIDIHVDVPAVNYKELSSDRKGESSEAIRERVIKARQVQSARFEGQKDVYKNADMGSKLIREHCKLDAASQSLLQTAMERLGLSARAYDRILKVSRTIADLAGDENINSLHISEAIQYRSLDRDYWGDLS